MQAAALHVASPHVSCPVKESPSPTTPPTPDNYFPAAMAMALDRHLYIAPAEAAAAAVDSTSAAAGSAVRQRRGWLRRMYTPVGAAEQEVAVTGAAKGDGAARKKPRRGGWLRRLVPREERHALRRRWKMLLGAPSRLAAGLPRWKRVTGLSVGGGWAPALLDAAAFRVMYVVEAVVLGLALSCFFCCCGCQI